MRVARYIGQGAIDIVEEPAPSCPEGGLLVRMEASGLCSGELMSWYMDRKVPHVLGHEVCGVVIESQDSRFPAGARVCPHHHAPCLKCNQCQKGRFVHCPQWKATKLLPGGMVDVFAVPAANLSDTLIVDDLRPVDAALIEPLGCVVKSLGMGAGGPSAVIGLGVMGLMHMLLLGDAVGYDLSSSRRDWAAGLGLVVTDEPGHFETVYVCPGSQAAFDAAFQMVVPGGTIVMFAPLAPGQSLSVPQEAYFQDIRICHAYSCGPQDTHNAAEAIRQGKLRAEQVVSQFIAMEDLPQAYQDMKAGKILKPMVVND